MSPSNSDAGVVTVNAALQVHAVHPIAVPSEQRLVPLEVKVTAPVTGDGLPVILLSHGHGASHFLASMRGYGPLVDFWAAHGFVVVQPTHLDYPGYGLRDVDVDGAPLFWRSRVEDMRTVLDHLDKVVAAVPGLEQRVDLSKVAAVGHSLGGHTAAMLSGMTVADPSTGAVLSLRDERVRAAVVMAGPGLGDGLAAPARERFPDLAGTSFDQMTTAALVVVGENDHNPIFSDRADWRADAFFHSPGDNKDLLTLVKGEHILGGVSGYDAAETTDENPERVATLRGLVWAYLRTTLGVDDDAWPAAAAELSRDGRSIGRLQQRPRELTTTE